MLIIRRLGICCAAGGAMLLAAVLGSPGALAAAAAPAAGLPSYGSDVTAQLLQDTLNALNISQGSGVTVAILSTGVDPDADGLQGKVTVGQDYVPLPYPPPIDGTILASAIAGSGPTGSDPFAGAGLAPQAKILSIRVEPDTNVPGGDAYFNTEDWQAVDAEAIRAAVSGGAQVILVDLTGGSSSQQLESAVQYATSKNAVVVCTEYQSDGSDPNAPQYPCALPGVLGAADVLMGGLVAPSTPVAAPANASILVAAPADQEDVSGPAGSFYSVQNYYTAVTWLAGTAALIKSVYPSLPPALVAQAIAVSARDHPAGGYNTTVGFGIINPYGALEQAATLSKLSDSTTSDPGVVGPRARLASGPVPGPISAVHHSPATLAEFGGATVAGLACLGAALVLFLRGRQQRVALASPAGPAPGQPGPAPGQAVPLAGVPPGSPSPVPWPGWPGTADPGWVGPHPDAPGPGWRSGPPGSTGPAGTVPPGTVPAPAPPPDTAADSPAQADSPTEG